MGASLTLLKVLIMAVYGSPKAPLGLHAGVQVGLTAQIPSSDTPAYVDMRGRQHCTAIIVVTNTTGVSGSAITIKQNTVNSTSNEQPVAFSKGYFCADITASTEFVEFDVSSNTFTTATTSSVTMIYLVEIPVEALNVSDGYRYVRIGTGDATNATVTVLYVLQ